MTTTSQTFPTLALDHWVGRLETDATTRDTIRAITDQPRLAESMRQAELRLLEGVVEAERERRFQDALTFLGRDRGPYALDNWWSRLNLVERQELILEVWESADAPVGALGERRWIHMFRDIGFVSDGPERPAEDMKVWRGASIESRGRGMSWSLSRDVAQWFASVLRSRYNIRSALYASVVSPDAVLGFTGFSEESRGEQEVIVDPSRLRARLAEPRDLR